MSGELTLCQDRKLLDDLRGLTFRAADLRRSLRARSGKACEPPRYASVLPKSKSFRGRADVIFNADVRNRTPEAISGARRQCSRSWRKRPPPALRRPHRRARAQGGACKCQL